MISDTHSFEYKEKALGHVTRCYPTHQVCFTREENGVIETSFYYRNFIVGVYVASFSQHISSRRSNQVVVC